MNEYDPDEQEETPPELDAGDIELLKTYGNGPYTLKIKDCEDEIKKHEKKVKAARAKAKAEGLLTPSQAKSKAEAKAKAEASKENAQAVQTTEESRIAKYNKLNNFSKELKSDKDKDVL